MSWWTYINGSITVSPIGRTQEEKEYVLKTVLKHLPSVTGSESDMNIKVIEKEHGMSTSNSCDEFGDETNNLINRYGRKDRKRGYMRYNDEYIIIVYGDLRDRDFEQTYREFIKWLTRLSKRVSVEDALVRIDGYTKSTIITNEVMKGKRVQTQFGQMFEKPSWFKEGEEPNWCEYLLWKKGKSTSFPMELEYKYHNNKENDDVVETLQKMLK